LRRGGLHVLGTERHESRRIDNQLRGRQGRQGDPGSSRFYVSLEDDLMRLFASDKIIGVMDKLGFETGQVLEHPLLNRALENAQKRVETHNFEIRKHLLEFDDVMNRQREVIYDLRRTVLESDDIKYMIEESVDETVRAAVATHLSQSEQDATWDPEGLIVYLRNSFLFDLSSHQEKLKDMTQEEVIDLIHQALSAYYTKKEQEIGVEEMRHLERILMLNTIDAKWKDHLYTMDQLKEGIGLRSYGQRDPIIEYKKEGFAMFEVMYTSVHQEVAELIFKIQPKQGTQQMKGVFSSLPQNLIHNETSGIAQAKAQAAQQQMMQAQADGAAPMPEEAPKLQPVRKDGPKVGRNDPCPCGSGKKYKKCCGQ